MAANSSADQSVIDLYQRIYELSELPNGNEGVQESRDKFAQIIPLADEVVSRRTGNVAMQKFYRLISDRAKLATGQRVPSPIFKDVMEHVSLNPASFSELQNYLVRSWLGVTIDATYNDTPSQDYRAAKKQSLEILKSTPPFLLFRAAHISGLGLEVDGEYQKTRRMHKDEMSVLLPKYLRAQYNKWKKANAQFIEECAEHRANDPHNPYGTQNVAKGLLGLATGDTGNAPSQPDAEAGRPFENDPRVTYIDVDHALVVKGTSAPTGAQERERGEDQDTTARRKGDPESRTLPLLEGLLNDPETNVEHIDIRTNVSDTGTTGNKSDLPYNVLDVKMKSGELARIFVCDAFGYMTFIRREAEEIQNDAQIFQLDQVRKDDKVWPAMHVTNEQWVGRVKDVLYTDLQDLSPESKTRVSWSGLKGVLLNSFAATVVHTGKPPAPNDKGIIQHGDLKGQPDYNWYKAYSTLQKRRFPGLEDATTFNRLLALCSDEGFEGGRYRALFQFISNPAGDKIQASDVEQALAAGDDSSQIMVAGYSADALDLALQFGAVVGLDDVLPANDTGTQPPQNLKEFRQRLAIG